MATKRAGALGFDSKKRVYFRSIGWHFVEGQCRVKQPKFYLGRDQQEAERRNLRLEQGWQCICECHLFHEHGRPVWDKWTLPAARAIARGEKSVRVPCTFRTVGFPDEDAKRYVRTIAILNQYFPVILFLPEEVTLHKEGFELYESELDAAREHVEMLETNVLGSHQALDAPHERLHHALDAYVDELEKEAHVSPWKNTKLGQARRLRQRHDDLPLSALDFLCVERMFKYWRNRPTAKSTNQPMAYNTCRNQLIQLKDFFKWLHNHPDYPWKRPDGYEDIKATPMTLGPDVSSKMRTLRIETYSPEELAIMYAAASPLMRLFILLGLNCGFAAAESGTLEESELFLFEKHPETGHYGIESSGQDSWIRRLRHKTQVYGEWKLWSHTVQGLRWAKKRRSQIDSREQSFLVTSRGESYCHVTEGKNKNSRVRNLWVSLIDRKIRAEHPDFRYLPFKQLRKTGCQLVRQFADGEIQGIFLAHGSPVKTDDLADVYSNRPFCRLFDALDKIEKHLMPMWKACPEPFVV